MVISIAMLVYQRVTKLLNHVFLVVNLAQMAFTSMGIPCLANLRCESPVVPDLRQREVLGISPATTLTARHFSSKTILVSKQ